HTCAKAVATGTTSILASVVFPEGKNEETLSLLNTIDKRVGVKGIGAVVEGIHAEGPLICDFGGLPRNSSEIGATEFGNLLDAMPGLKVMTVSPHVASKTNYQVIKMLHDRGVVPSLGHDRQADEQEIVDALSVSKTQPCHITHLYNVSKFHHRNPGLVNFGLLDSYPSLSKYDDVVAPTVELIGDMIHVHPLAVKLVLSSRSWDQIAFVTDCVAHRSQAHRTITYDGRQIKVDKENNVVKSCDDDTLVGSCCTMLDIFNSLINVLNVPVGKAFMMLSENPARFAKLNNVGTIEVGKDANLVMFDHNYNLMKTFVDGRMAFRTSLCRKKSVVSTESFDESFNM
ncbi:N-acetylglucosamine-6-phosphate deacetylase, partial [Paramuricea clavata]